MTKNKLKIGIIGAGMIGDVHIKNIRKDGRAAVKWIATRTQKTLDEKIKKFDLQHGTRDYKEILDDPEVDAVLISAPPFTHYEMLKNSLEAGKHVLMEKPLAPNSEEVEAMVAEVEKYPELTVLECSCRHARLQPKFDFVKNIIDSGKLGDVYYIHHNHVMRSTFIEWNPAGGWALQKEKAGGGPLVDWGVYDLSFHLGLLDDKPELNSVRSFTKNGLKVFPEGTSVEPDIEEHGVAYLTFNNGLKYFYERGAGAHFEVQNKTRIYGTRGGLQFSFCSWDPAEVEFYYLDKEDQEQHKTLKVDVPEEHDDDFELTKHFLDCLLEDAEPGMPVQLAAKHMDIIYQILDNE